MRYSVLALFSLLFVPAACGGSATHESLAEQGLLHMEQFATLLEGIKDEATAKAAAPQLDKLMEQLMGARAQVEKLPPRTPELEQALNKKFAERLQAAGLRFGQAIMKFKGDQKIEAVLKPVLEKFNKVK